MTVAGRYPTPFPSALSGSWLDGWRALNTGLADVTATMLRGGGAAFDLPRFAEISTRRGRPTWTTPHELVFAAPLARLRDFSSDDSSDVVPTVVLPPQAGHDSCIVDFSPEQSQMQTILDAGLSRALSLDWAGATAATADATIEDYIAIVDRAVEHCGGRVNLIGDCQGGWLSAIYAALKPERVNTLTLAGAPIDFQAGDPIIHEVVRGLAPTGDLWFYEMLVAAGGGVLRGEHMLAGFITMRPADEIARHLELLLSLDNGDHVARYQEFEDWFKHTQDIPGAFYLWIVRHLFADNELINGRLTVGGETVDLGRLTMPLQLLAGAEDHITPPAQVFAIADAASTPAKNVLRDTAPGGHLGLFMGHRALREHWPALLDRVGEHSGVAPART